MYTYRIKQFVWSIEANFKKIDYGYVKTYLNDEEFELFNRLSKSDKYHSIRVCRSSLQKLKEYKYNDIINTNELAKVALLHDIGKSKKSLNVIEKSIIVLLDKITKGKLKKYKNINIIDIYYNHPAKGVAILQKFSYSEDFLEAIEKHHSIEKNENNKILKLLKESDDEN